MLAENWGECSVKNTLRAGESHSAHVCVERVASFMGGQGIKAGGLGYQEEVAPTFKAAPSGGNTVPDVVYAINDKATRNRGGGSARQDDGAMYTLDTACRHAISYAIDCRNGALNEELSGTLQAKPNGGQSLNFQNPVCYSSGSYGGMSEGVGTLGTGTRATAEMVAVYPNVTGPLMANSHPGSYTGQDAFSDMLPVVSSDQPQRKYIVRRLTPLECCRLQGFPDWWEDGVEGSDSARYKMWGNGMALPNMLHVMRGIARQHEKELVR
jgi:DNA (cytosine-5)-methyltransferase 1